MHKVLLVHEEEEEEEEEGEEEEENSWSHKSTEEVSRWIASLDL